MLKKVVDLDKPTIMKKIVLMAMMAFVLIQAGQSQVNNLAENFNTAPPATWPVSNMSNPVGIIGWFQGNNAVFNAQNGGSSSYLGCNFNSTTGTGTISNWIFTPLLNLNNGALVTFYTRKPTPDTYPDRLELRLSTNGASTNVGANEFSTGDYSTLVLSINPTLVTGVYPTSWTQYSVNLSGLPAGNTPGRLAFRYFVTNGGPTGANSDYIGIDHFTYDAAVLPVALLNFSVGVQSDNVVNLQWNTAQEINSNYFSVERSLDGKTFNEIGKVRAMGNSNSFQTYHFTDPVISRITNSSIAYYRLRQVDLDSKNTLSNVQQARFKRANVFAIDYASLVNNRIFIRYNVSQSCKVIIKVISQNGQVLFNTSRSSSTGLNTFESNKDLPKGIYYISISNENERVGIMVIN